MAAALQVFTDINILGEILSNLYPWDAEPAVRIWKVLRSRELTNPASEESLQNLEESLQHLREGVKTALLITSSKRNKLVRIDTKTGLVDKDARVIPVGERGLSKDPQACWPTGICFNPGDGHLYVSQYKRSSVMIFDGVTLKFLGILCSSFEDHPDPEGIAIAKNHLYLASVGNGTICRIGLTGADRGRTLQQMDCGGDRVPWGIELGPDGALYAAVDNSYHADNYGVAPESRTGQVLRIQLGDNGELPEAGEDICEPGLLSRPSGICFDPQKRMYVTSHTGEVLRFDGPSTAVETQELLDGPKTKGFGAAASKAPRDRTILLGSVFIEANCNGAGLKYPWDIKYKRKRFYVTTHDGSDGSSDQGCSSVNVYDAGGVLLEVYTSKELIQPNMMVLE